MVQDQFVVVVAVAVKSRVIGFLLRVYDLSFRTASSRDPIDLKCFDLNVSVCCIFDTERS